LGTQLTNEPARAAAGEKRIRIPEKHIPIAAEADVVVIGGGPAGFGAAMRSARSGVRTLLIERFGGPGGAATSGYMCVTGEGPTFPLHTEWVTGIQNEGWLFDAWKTYPQLPGNVLVHQSGRMNFYPDDGAYVMIRMLEKAGVRLLFRTLFVDAVVKAGRTGDSSIDAVVVENASGRQAIKAKVFIDATGRADVVARAGAPFKSAGNEKGLPVPFSLMYRVSGVDYQKLFDYQKIRSCALDRDRKGRGRRRHSRGFVHALSVHCRRRLGRILGMSSTEHVRDAREWRNVGVEFFPVPLGAERS
jgi:hypothetical protein